MQRPRLRAYGYTWLLCLFAALPFTLFDYTHKVATAAPGDHSLVGTLVSTGLLALFGLPALLLLRIFPEPSRSSLVRLLRRGCLGLVCGTVAPALLCGAFAALKKLDDPDAVKWLATFGAIFGWIGGLVDAGSLDARRRETPLDAGRGETNQGARPAA